MFSLDDRLVTNRYSPTTSVGLFLAMCDPELGALDDLCASGPQLEPVTLVLAPLTC